MAGETSDHASHIRIPNQSLGDPGQLPLDALMDRLPRGMRKLLDDEAPDEVDAATAREFVENYALDLGKLPEVDQIGASAFAKRVFVWQTINEVPKSVMPTVPQHIRDMISKMWLNFYACVRVLEGTPEGAPRTGMLS